jgi:hypothetical protein
MADQRRFDTIERVVRDTRRGLDDLQSTVMSRLASHTHAGGGVGLLAGTVDTYGDLAAIAAGLGPDDAGTAYLNEADGQVYVWDGSAFPVEGDGVSIVGPEGPQGPQGDTGGTGPTGPAGADGTNGANGVSVTDAEVDGSGHLQVTLSNATVIDAGYVVGPAGPEGPEGPEGPAGTSYTDEQVRDVIAATLVAGANVTITPDDVADTITIAASGGGGGGGIGTFRVGIAPSNVGPVTNSIALVDATGMSLSVVANTRYAIDGFVNYDHAGASSPRGGMRLQLNAPAGSTGGFVITSIVVAVTAFGTPVQVIASTTGAASNNAVPLGGWIQTAGTSGTLQVQFAQQAASSTGSITLRAGSYLTLTEIG